MILLRVLAFILGFVLLAETWLSAIKTLVLPRSARDPITGFVFRSMRWLFNIRLKRARTYPRARPHPGLLRSIQPAGAAAHLAVHLQSGLHRDVLGTWCG